MKQAFLLICCCLPLLMQAQQKTIKKKTYRRYGTGLVREAPAPPPIFVYVEQMAEFPGGNNALLQYVNAHTRYPDHAREAGIEGKVMIQFVINADGQVADPVVLRSIGGGCDQEAMRVVKSLPQWKPAKKNGRAVKSYFILPVRFTIE